MSFCNKTYTIYTRQLPKSTWFSTLEEQLDTDDPVRLVDTFIYQLDLEKLEFSNTLYKREGRPPYTPAELLKLYLYRYQV